jgi:hypothetical protein
MEVKLLSVTTKIAPVLVREESTRQRVVRERNTAGSRHSSWPCGVRHPILYLMNFTKEVIAAKCAIRNYFCRFYRYLIQ